MSLIHNNNSAKLASPVSSRLKMLFRRAVSIVKKKTSLTVARVACSLSNKSNKSYMSCKLKGMQGFQNVLKYIAADSGKVGGCGNQDCLSQADCYDQM